MRIGIFGRHPLLEPGFNSTMSFYTAAGFAKLGCDVVIIHPSQGRYRATSTEAREFGELASVYLPASRVTWQGLEDFAATGQRFDVGIWQSYAKDEEEIFAALRARSRLMSKNQPRLFCHADEDDLRRLQNLGRKFDLIGFALREDHNRAEALRPRLRHPVHFTFVGRGACPELLNRAGKAAEPTIFVDMPPKPIDGTGELSLRHVWPALEQLRESHKSLKVLTFGGKTSPDFVQRGKSAPFWGFYERYITPSWLLFTFDYSKTIHNTRKVEVSPDHWVFLGQYENQIMETHSSGGIVAAHVSDLAEELTPPELRLAFFESFDDIPRLHGKLCHAIEAFASVSPQARSFGATHHHYLPVAERWLAALQTV